MLAANFLAKRMDPEAAAFIVIEYRAENTWGVEVWRAVPIDRTIHAHKGSGTQVQDVTGLVSQFKQMQRMMKKLSGGKGGQIDPRELMRRLR